MVFDKIFNLIMIYYYVVTPARYPEGGSKLQHRLVFSFHTSCLYTSPQLDNPSIRGCDQFWP